MFQEITIIGDLGRDPEMRYTPSGQAVTNFSVATTNKYQDSSGEWVTDTTWFRVSTWGKMAESSYKFLEKGSRVMVKGRVKCHVYEKKDKTWEGTLEVNASTVKFLDKKGNNGARKKEEPQGEHYDDMEEIPGFMQD